MIRTKWHRLLELLDTGQVYMTCPPKGGVYKEQMFAPHYEELGFDLNMFRRLLGDLEKIPKFIIDNDLIGLAKEYAYVDSLLDMQDAGVMRLSYPAMIIEWEPNKASSGTATRLFVLIRDLQATDECYPWEEEHILTVARSRATFYGITFSIEKDEDGEYIVVAPGLSWLGLQRGPEGDPEPRIHMETSPIGFCQKSKELDALLDRTHLKIGSQCWHGVYFGLLMMATAGIEREVIECHKLNKARRASGKPSIPTHTYIHIARVYKSAHGDDSTVYVPGKSPRPHWRRGHLRGVRYGAKKAFVKSMFIAGRLVAFKGDTEIPAIPNYKVAR